MVDCDAGFPTSIPAASLANITPPAAALNATSDALNVHDDALPELAAAANLTRIPTHRADINRSDIAPVVLAPDSPPPAHPSPSPAGPDSIPETQVPPHRTNSPTSDACPRS